MAKPNSLDWDDLRYFLSAVRAQSLSGAARTLGVKHSTIGRRLTALERSLGAPLVSRRADGVHLTPLGEEVAPLAEDVERAALVFERAIAARTACVRLTVPTVFTRILAPSLSAFRRTRPDITLEIAASALPVDLAKGEADIALSAGPQTDPDLLRRKVGDSEFSLFASQKYLARRRAPADPRDLTGQEVIGYQANLAATPGARWIATHGAGATIVLRCREISEMLAAAVSGLGLAVVPCQAAATEPSLRRLTDEVLGTAPLWLVYRKETILAEPARAVIDLLVRVMRELPRAATRPVGDVPGPRSTSARARPREGTRRRWRRPAG